MTRQPDKRRLGRAVGVMMSIGRYDAPSIAGAFRMPNEKLERIISGDTRDVPRATVINLYDYLAALIDVPLISDLRGDARTALARLEEIVAALVEKHGYGPEAIEILKTMKPVRKRSP